MNSSPMANPGATETVQVSVANLTREDAQFLRNVISVLSDPALLGHLVNLREGKSLIAYHGTVGLYLIPTSKP